MYLLAFFLPFGNFLGIVMRKLVPSSSPAQDSGFSFLQQGFESPRDRLYSMQERNKAVPASYLILKKGNEVLLQRRKGSGYYDGWYSVPSGHVEEGELPIDCLIREMKEEIGIDLEKERVSLAHLMYRVKHNPTGDRMDYFFVANEWQGEPRICEPDKCDDLSWFPVSELPENIIYYIKAAIEYAENGEIYSEWDINRLKKYDAQ